MRLKISTRDMREITSLLILTPLFFLYFALEYYGLASGLGGYFGIAVVACFLALVPYEVLRFLFRFRMAKTTFVFLMCVFVLSLILVAGTVGQETQSNILPTYAAVLIAWITLYTYASCLRESRVFEFFSKASFLITTAVIVVFSDETFSFSLGTSQIFDADTTNPTYQFFAVFFIIGLLPILVNCTPRIAELVLATSLLMLLLIGSRTDLVVFAVAYIAMKFIANVSLKSVVWTGFSATVFYFMIQLVSSSEYNRLALFLRVGGGDNQTVRSIAAQNAWSTIYENPILGSAGSYERGHYAHSIISIWVDFGLLGFLTFVFLILYFLVKAYTLRKFKTSKGVNLGAFSLALLIAVIMALCVTKSGTYYLVPAALGFVSCVDVLNRRQKKREVPLSEK